MDNEKEKLKILQEKIEKCVEQERYEIEDLNVETCL